MKKEEIKIRVSTTLKQDFQDICENEETTMSNKINNFIFDEIKTKKIENLKNRTSIQKLIHFNVHNKNGRLYQKSDLLGIKLDENGLEYTELDRLNNVTLHGQFGFCSTGDKIHKYNATHSINNLRIEEDWLIGDVTILNDSIGHIFDKLVFRVRGFGEVDDKGVVQGLEIIGFDAILKSEDKTV
jgi:antitoxin component of RelBE/YafQ-DinJ toxin-antitoxin module